jgi:sensor c-di-GMP phosphodiesterase-like protein
MNLATKTVKSYHNDTYVILQKDFDNKKKIRIRILETSNPNVVIDPSSESKFGSVHRENIILDDTIGFQITNLKCEQWEHKANEVIKSTDDALLKLSTSIHREPDAKWNIIQIAKDSIQNLTFI